ncbi:MAG: PHP domain protein [Candidatus Argoarchaeum ethanivorans]|uniref:PHP domain protein n=1 Tax=Candidatus Argoarchaeum ethanivorans TaxID=2608793 RepID=A0A811T6L7_9EURY|nr:MAG: PHP domain protein [Candidatus Argoarchaeum ethanivorans]
MIKMKYDLHIHSKYSSDGILEPKEIIKTAIKKGLNGIAITDHNTIKGGLEAKKYENEDFKVIIGSEIMTERGEIIGLFLEEEVKSNDVQEVVSEIKEQNGIVVIPHPFDELRHSAFHPAEEDAKFIDCIEGFNSRCVHQKYNEKAVEFGTKHGLVTTAGSDAHFANEIGNAGIITETDDVREALMKNDINIFGKRSSLVNHVGTKVLKTWRKTVRFG